VLRRIEQALLGHEVFIAAARPKRLVRLLISRYEPGMTYGTHVDDALMEGVRTDLSFTLFLSDPDSYEGGALVIEDSYGERPIRLPAGELILYPSTSLHRVEPLSSGVRLAAVGWVRSYIRDPARREVLFDLEMALRQVHAQEGKSAVFDTLVKSRTNLLRLWAED
jgi:PKHD-type hydroxylase